MLEEHLKLLGAQLDETALKKRLSIEAEHLKRIKCTKILRIYTQTTNGTLKINTRVIGEDTKSTANTTFWQLIKRIVVGFNTCVPTVDEELSADGIFVDPQPSNTDQASQPSPNTDQASQPDCEIFEWDSSSHADAFSVRIKPEINKIQLLLKLKNSREVYKMSKKIRLFLGKYSDTLQNVIKDLYKYINTNRLNEYSTGIVKCNEELKNLFGVDSFNFTDIVGHIARHLEPIEYCVINLEIGCKQIWDIELETDDLAQMPVLYPKNVMELEKKIASSCETEERLAERIKNIEEFAADPVFYVNKRIALESEGLGVQSAFYDNLDVQTAVYELIRKYESSDFKKQEKE